MGISGRLTTTAAVNRFTRTTDGRGGWTRGYSSVGNISCRISLKFRGDDERSRALRDEGLGEYKVFTLTTADIQVHDRLVAGALTYEVRSVGRPSRGNHYEWAADLVEDGT